MDETIEIRLHDAEKTHSAGVSLAKTLYETSVDILLVGELGAGKTTFLKGFAEGLGIQEDITSPTYALEQRYRVRNLGSGSGLELIHIDLYRLSENEAAHLIEGTNDHEGIRCIEWADRLKSLPSNKTIFLHFSEPEPDTRTLKATFNDLPLPTPHDIDAWRKDVMLSQHIIDHCITVANFAQYLGNKLIERGQIVRPLALKRAGELHDLLRFVDFAMFAERFGKNANYSAGSSALNADISKEQEDCWTQWKEKYPDCKHEEACARFLCEHKYHALAEIVEPHGLKLPSPERRTIEQQLLFYADKRVKFDEVVSLEERFRDFRERYTDGEHTKQGDIWHQEAKDIEQQLFPEGEPC